MLYGAEVIEQGLAQAADETVRTASDSSKQAAFFAEKAPWHAHQRRLAIASFADETLPNRAISLRESTELVCPITREPLSALTAAVLFDRHRQW